ncbi:MAG: acyl-CoA dehydrogenase family protein [Acidobacteriota bacterium]
MANFFNKNRKFILDTINLEDVVRELEDNFEGNGPDSLNGIDEALTWYDMLLNNAGEIAADRIWPNAEAVDAKGAVFENGDVRWADETVENMNILAEAGFMGGTLERKYGGLNLPNIINSIIIEMISQADASLMNLFGLQDIAVTIQKFGSEEQKERILPKFARGEVSGAMSLTEPDAGSDLQTVKLKAVEKNGKWYLNGVKHFITNGSGDVHLVLARTEEGVNDGRGLSMMLYERDENMTVRRIENKLGIHGSPTCELHYNMAECELIGKRRFGLIKYMMSLLNGARLATSSQALGIAQAAFEEAVKYANEREQFGQKIVNFPAVYQMLKKMEAEVETSRLLLYHSALAVDLQEIYTKKLEKGENVRKEMKEATILSNFLTPLGKFVCTEMSNQVSYDSLQIHGGVGYMKDFPVERLYRDARITNIYEGTTQLQVVAAIGAVTSGFFFSLIKEKNESKIENLTEEKKDLIEYISEMEKVVDLVKEADSKEFLDFVANYIIEMASIIYRLYLFLPIADKFEEKRELYKFYSVESNSRLKYLADKVKNLLDNYGKDIGNIKESFIKK